MTSDGKPENGDIFVASSGPFIVIGDKDNKLVGIWIGTEGYGQSRINVDSLVRSSKYYGKMASIDLLNYIVNETNCDRPEV